MSKKNAIVKNSIDFLKKHSFKELSFELLAKEFNVSKTAIHYYFPKKIDLGIAICETLEEGLIQQLDVFKKEPDKASVEFIHERLSFLRDNEICPIITLQSEYNDFEKLLQDKVKELGNSEYSVYVDILARNINKKEAESIAQVHLSAIKGAQYYSRSLSLPFDYTVMKYIEKSFLNNFEGGW
jgi:TetR/AcrR family transcriptional repressor of nem operon